MSASQGDTGQKQDIVQSGGSSALDPAELIDATEAARLLRQKSQTLATWRSENRGPAFFKIGRAVYYSKGGISDYIASCLVRPGSAS